MEDEKPRIEPHHTEIGHVDIPWFKRWEEKDKTPPDPDFVARLEELEYK